jgi:hypothetical protein
MVWEPFSGDTVTQTVFVNHLGDARQRLKFVAVNPSVTRDPAGNAARAARLPRTDAALRGTDAAVARH